MAYPVKSLTQRAGTDGTASATIDLTSSWPANSDLVSGDVICIVAHNDGGGTALSISGTWTELGGPAPTNSASRTAVWLNDYNGTAIPAPTLTGSNDEWAVIVFVIRDSTGVANIVSSFNEITTNTGTPATTGVTTVSDDNLILSIIGFDGNGGLMPSNPLGTATVAYRADRDNSAILSARVWIDYTVKQTAGYTGAYQWTSTSNDGGRTITLAFPNKTNGVVPSYCVTNNAQLIHLATGTVTVTALNDWHTTLLGFPTETAANAPANGTIVNQDTSAVELGFNGYYHICGQTQGTGDIAGIYGGAFPITETDFTDGLFYAQIKSYPSTQISRRLLYFRDALGEWAVVRITSDINLNSWVTVCSYLPNSEILEGSGSINWARITYVGGLCYAIAVGFSRTIGIYFRPIFKMPFTSAFVFAGGTYSQPATTRQICDVLAGGMSYLMPSLQGEKQNLINVPIQIGNGGTNATYFTGNAASLEFANTFQGSLYRNNDLEFRVNLGASDVFRMAALAVGSGRPQKFTIDASSSTAGTNTWAGTIFGMTTTLNGKKADGAVFTGCSKVDAGGASLVGCKFDSCIDADTAVTVTDGADLTDATFEKGSETYAIEVSGNGPQAIDLTDAVFTGYTKPLNILGTTGTITFTLSFGQSVPTYDTAGATVAFDQPVVSTTYTNNAVEDGTSILVRNITAGTTIEYVASLATGTGYAIEMIPSVDYTAGDDIEIRMTKHDGLTYTDEYTYEITTSASGGDLISTRIPPACAVCNAINLDGSDYDTLFSADYSNDEVDIQTATNFYMTTFMVWWRHNMTNQTAMEQFWGAITIEDAANVRNNTAVSRVRFDNLTTTNIYQNDNIRYYADDGARPVKDASTGGGGVDLVWKKQIYIAETGVSGLTAGESALLNQIANLALEATAQSVKAKTDNLPTDPATQASVDVINGIVDNILLDTAELQTNQGQWLTATGFATPTNVTDAQGVITSAIGALNDISTTDVATELATYDAPTKAEMDSAFTEIKGPTFSATDTLEAIRDRGDSAWTTATGFATPTNVTDAQTAIIADVNANEVKIDALETKAQADARQALLIAEHDATQATLAGLNDFNPATDVVANVTLVDTVTTNTDMRGTDGANTVAPDNTGIANTLAQATLARKHLTNRDKIDTTANTLTRYDDNGTTALVVFDLKDADGVASTTSIFEKTPQ